MENLTITNILLCICGMAIHTFMKWGKLKRQNRRFSASIWIRENWFNVAATVLSCLAMLIMLDDICNFLNIKREGTTFTEITAFLIGYVNQSILRNLQSVVVPSGSSDSANA